MCAAVGVDDARTLQASHSPFLLQPDATADALESTADDRQRLRSARPTAARKRGRSTDAD